MTFAGVCRHGKREDLESGGGRKIGERCTRCLFVWAQCPCRECKGEFSQPLNGKQRYCGERCLKDARNRREREKRAREKAKREREEKQAAEAEAKAA